MVDTQARMVDGEWGNGILEYWVLNYYNLPNLPFFHSPNLPSFQSFIHHLKTEQKFG
jgi:hypothetical protein